MGVTVSPNIKKEKIFINAFTGKPTNPPGQKASIPTINKTESGDNKGTGEAEKEENRQEAKE